MVDFASLLLKVAAGPEVELKNGTKYWSVFSRVHTMSLGEASKAYEDAGFYVVPVEQNGKQRVGAIAMKGRVNASVSLAWSSNPLYNIGLLTGGDFFVVDVDGPRGFESMRWLKEHVSDVSGDTKQQTICVESSRGYHMYFQTEGEKIPTTIGVLPGIDIRGEDGMIVAPPSISATGKCYSLTSPEKDYEDTLNTAPQSLLSLIMLAKPMVIPEGKTEEESRGCGPSTPQEDDGKANEKIDFTSPFANFSKLF